MFLAADFVSFILMLKKKKEGRFSGIDKDLGMRNRDGQARKKKLYGAKQFGQYCYGNLVLQEQFGGLDKALLNGSKVSSTLVIHSKSQRSSDSINFSC